MAPRISELIVGPLSRPGIYPRAARLPPARTLLLLLVATAICGGLLAARWYGVRRAALEEVRNSELRQLPTVTVQDGQIRSLDAGPRAFDAGPFVVWLELETNLPTQEDIREQLRPGERRPIVHLGKDAIVVYPAGGSPKPLPWTELNEREGVVSVSGETVADWLAKQLGGRAVDAWTLGISAGGLYQVLLLLFLGLFYRVLFFRGPDVPSLGALTAAGAVSALPALYLVTILGLCGFGQLSMIVVHFLAFGLNFLFMAGCLRVELSAPPSHDDLVARGDKAALMPGVGAADLEAMREQGLVSEEDYALARGLLGIEGEAEATSEGAPEDGEPSGD